MLRLSEFKGEEAFKVMGRVVGGFKAIFKDETALKIVKGKEEGWMLDFLEYTLTEQSGLWLNLYCTLTPNAKKEDVSTADVFDFAYEFTSDEKLMSLFFSQSRMITSKTSIGSATEITEV